MNAARTDRLSSGAVSDDHSVAGGLSLQSGSLHLRIVALRTNIVRIRMAEYADWTEPLSWAVADEARRDVASVETFSNRDAVGFSTDTLTITVARASGLISIEDSNGNPVSLDAEAWPATLQNSGFTINKAMLPGERIFGLGDQPGPLDRCGRTFTLWNTDAVSYQESSSPLYKSIPFFLAVRPAGCCGILLDNTWRSTFDFGQRQRGVVAFGAEGGAADYYVIHGADARDVLRAYADLTGHPPLPPLWALGFQQSRYSYMSQREVVTVAEEFRSRQFPADVIYCDIDYQDRYRPFTVDQSRFPTFRAMVASLADIGFRTVAITDLHIACVDDGYEPFRSGMAGDHFVRRPSGDPYSGTSWPGAAVFPDFTRADTRVWWGHLYEGFVRDGIAGFWNDMNEPSISSEPTKTMPLDIVHRIEEPGRTAQTAPHAAVHNVVGMQNARATFEGVTRFRPNERPFVLTRASFAGGQRYGWSWTGDNTATWNHLRMTTAMLVNAGLSGLPFIGADVGGFFGSPSPALLTRWFQVAAFHPLFRNHCFTQSAPREPWLHGSEHEALRRRAVEERYRLLPYLYTAAEEAARTGLPMLRPLFLEFPSALHANTEYNQDPDSQFLVGDAMMVAPPIYGEMPDPYVVTLPDPPWYDYWTGRRIDVDLVAVDNQADVLPVFVHAGSIIPRHACIQHTGEIPSGSLELCVYPGGECTGSVYSDDGHSLEYRNGRTLHQRFTYRGGDDGAEFHFSAREGVHFPWWTTIELVIHGMDEAPSTVVVDQADLLGVAFDEVHGILRIAMTDTAGPDKVSITWSPRLKASSGA